MRDLVRRNLRFFLYSTLAALALRFLFLFRFPAITSDSFVYGDIAKNWLQHGIYGISSPDGITPTYVRLPGYPAFLAGIFAVFGLEHYRAVLFIQLLVDVGGCLLVADLARRLVSERAAKAAYLLAGLCPFFANYAAAALSETLEIFFTALALDIAVANLQSLDAAKPRRWIACGLAIAASIYLRPDGGILLASLLAYLAWLAVKSRISMRAVLTAATLLAIFSLAPLIPWTLRNYRIFHHFAPLAPRYANEDNEYVALGFNRWVRTWIADYASTEEIYWSVPGDNIDTAKLPSRAFDSLEQREQTQEVIADYNEVQKIDPQLDQRFNDLALARIHGHAFRYYVELPFLRVADMWLRPRTEILPSDTRWWEFNDDPLWSTLAVVLGVVSLAYIALALLGLVRGKFLPHLGLLLTFVILRSAFLATLENPEPRYTLECYPVVFVLAAACWRETGKSN